MPQSPRSTGRSNAFRAKTIEELVHAFKGAWTDPSRERHHPHRCLTAAGHRAFSVGGNVKRRNETGDDGPTENGPFEVTYVHRPIRETCQSQ